MRLPSAPEKEIFLVVGTNFCFQLDFFRAMATGLKTGSCYVDEEILWWLCRSLSYSALFRRPFSQRGKFLAAVIAELWIGLGETL